MPPSRAGRKGERLWKWIRRLFKLTLAAVVLLAGVVLGSYFYFFIGLPSVEELRRRKLFQVTKVTCRDGNVCAEFFKERRTSIDIRQMPPHVRDAFLAAEDADFYKHNGLDYWGMLRSGIKNLKPGGMKSGASTISQQACRGLMLSQERTLSRKIREWILTPRMEEALTKDEILNLYVNSVYFGHGRYGVEEASLFYFGKHTKDLTLGEAAVIAGTVQSPLRKNPITNIVRAKTRQRYVLEQLTKHGFVKKPLTDAEMDKPIVLGARPPTLVGSYYAEDVRKQLVARYGEDAVLSGGLRVEVAMDPKLQIAAEAAVRAGLETVDRRQGYRGPVGKIELSRFKALRPLLEKRLAEAGKRRPDDVLIADLEALKPAEPAVELAPLQNPGSAIKGEVSATKGDKPKEAAKEPAGKGTAKPPEPDDDDPVDPDEPIPTDDEKLSRGIGVKTLGEGVETVGLVSAVDDAKGVATVDLVSRQAQLSFKTSTWARRKSEAGLGNPPVRMSDVVAAGDLVRVRLGKAIPSSQLVEAALAQIPVVQGALLAIDPKDRSVVAMVGGYDFALSPFNRATQAERQPGSSFKPFLYSAALSTGKFTPISVLNDAPETVRDHWTGKSWKPQNYEKGGFEGPMSMREALTKSKNTVSVRIIEAIGPEPVIDFAHHAGIKTETCSESTKGRACLPVNLTLALGTGEVRMIDIANAYTTLQSLGRYAEPLTVLRVRDASGKVLEEHHAAPEQQVTAAVAYVGTSLMRSVVEEGTAMAVLELRRPAAGKTGTAQEFRDAWFSGYTMDYVASAWVGFDDHSPIGPGETGGRAALPLWLDFMKVAHEGLPVSDFEPPEGVVQVRIDPQSGKLAGRSVPGRLEAFLAGTEPTQEAPAPGTVDPNDFLIHDGRKGGL